MKAKIILASDIYGGIGKNGTIPWPIIKNDMKHFARLTKGTSDHKNCVIMGRATWESLPKRPLVDRYNIVLSNKFSDCYKNTQFVSSWNDIHDIIKEKRFKETWIVGGESIYNECFSHFDITDIYLTLIDGNYECDRRVPLKRSLFEADTFYWQLTNNTLVNFDINHVSSTINYDFLTGVNYGPVSYYHLINKSQNHS